MFRTVAASLFLASSVIACQPASGVGMDAGASDGAVTTDAAFDATEAGDGCSTSAVSRGGACSTPGLECNGPRFMCYSATAVGPAGIDRCRCDGARWQCTDVCADWLARERDR